MNYNKFTALGQSRIKFLNSLEGRIKNSKRFFNILETGAGHHPTTDDSASMTFIFASLLKKYYGGNVLTIDINEDNLNKCRENTNHLSSFIEYKLGDSVQCIQNLNDDYIKSLDLIFLDSYDLFLFNPNPSAIHHLKELLFLFERINPDCWVAIDDNFLPNTWIDWIWSDGRRQIFETKDKTIGKGMFCHDFLIKNDWIRDESVLFQGINNIFLYKSKSHFESYNV